MTLTLFPNVPHRNLGLVQTGVFRLQDTFKVLKWANKCTKRPKIAISVNFEGTNELKLIDKPSFSYMNPYSPISWLYVHGFLGQNLKNWILRLLLDIWKSGSVCAPPKYSFHFTICHALLIIKVSFCIFLFMHVL